MKKLLAMTIMILANHVTPLRIGAVAYIIMVMCPVMEAVACMMMEVCLAIRALAYIMVIFHVVAYNITVIHLVLGAVAYITKTEHPVLGTVPYITVVTHQLLEALEPNATVETDITGDPEGTFVLLKVTQLHLLIQKPPLHHY